MRNRLRRIRELRPKGRRRDGRHRRAARPPYERALLAETLEDRLLLAILQVNQPLDIAFRPVINEFRGMRSVEIHLVDWRVSAKAAR